MPATPGWVRSRKTVQVLALVGFVGLFVLTQRNGLEGDLANLPMRLDPLLVLTSDLAGRTIAVGSALALATVVLTLLFGRAWCGWLCPLGTVLDAVPSRRSRRPVPEGWRNVKYALLIVIVSAALLGNQTLLFLDPLAIVFRTLTTAVWPAFDRIVVAIEDVALQIPGAGGPIDWLDSVLRPGLLPDQSATFEDAAIFAGFFAGIVALNALAPRFWCRYLCPLGGLLGLLSRFAIVQRRVGESCSACGICAEDCPTGTIDPARNHASDPAECTVCMKCVEGCPLSGVAFKAATPQVDGRPYDPSRRQVLLGLGTAAVAVALFRADLLTKRQSPFLLRPPGSRETNADPVAFTSCTRCGECARVCPTNAIQPAFMQAGLEGMGTPVLVPRIGYCDYTCTACGQVCPTQAIPWLGVEDKQRQVVGKSYIDQNRCLAWSDHLSCLICQEVCPLPEKAIVLEDQEVWTPDGNVTIGLPHVLRDLCIGCGLCEYRCPVSGEAAIRVHIPPLPSAF
jgi:ferredoxin